MEKLTRREFVLAAGIGGAFAVCAMLAVMLFLVMGGFVPLPTAAPLDKSPVEAKPTTVPEWATKTDDGGEQGAITNSIARLLKTRKEVAPVKKSKYPQLDPEKMQKGDVGYFAVFRIEQVVADDSFIANVDNVQGVVFTGMSTAELSDGRMLAGVDLPVEVLGPIGYKTVEGGFRTLLLVRPLDAEAAAKNSHRMLSETEWKRRTGQVSPITGR